MSSQNSQKSEEEREAQLIELLEIYDSITVNMDNVINRFNELERERLGYDLPTNDTSKVGDLDNLSADSYWVGEDEDEDEEEDENEFDEKNNSKQGNENRRDR
jgi:hypothetical protein